MNSAGLQRAYWRDPHPQRLPDHPVCQFFSEQRWRFVEQHADLSSVTSVFDLGCGVGMASWYFRGTQRFLVGGDFSPEQLRANILDEQRKVTLAGEHLPFPDASFDLVTCWEVLHHAADAGQVVREMARVSRRWLVIFEPNTGNPAQFLYSALIPAERGTLRLRRSLVEGALANAGCELLFFGRVGWILPNKSPMWLFNRLRGLPFRLPALGISRLWIARRTTA